MQFGSTFRHFYLLQELGAFRIHNDELLPCAVVGLLKGTKVQNLLLLRLNSVVQITHDKIFHRLLLREICEMMGVVTSTGVNVERIRLLKICCISGNL